jgi:hypothetical protein
VSALLTISRTKVADTFKASYKAPMPRSPQPTGALSYIGVSIQNTVKSVLLSPTKKAADQKLREDERLQDEIEELCNTYYYDPNGDLNDEVMKQVFLQRSPIFDYRVSPQTMHLIDLVAYFGSEDALVNNARPRLCDAVATVLSHTDKACLQAFLDPSIKEFAYRREIENNKGGLILIIRREGNEVIVGAYVNFGFMLQWKLYVKSTVNITGQWHEVYAASKPGMMPVDNGIPKWDTVTPDTPESKVERATTPEPPIGSPRKLLLSPTKKKIETPDDSLEKDPKFMLFQSRYTAKYLLWDIWCRFENLCECRATWEADGTPNAVRLTRALVECDGDDE